MHIALDLGQSELDVGAGGEAGEVVDHVVEDEVEAAGHARGDEAVELDDVGVVEAAEDEDLPGHEAHALGLQVVEPHLLERHDLAAQRVPRLVHIAVRPLPDLNKNARTCSCNEKVKRKKKKQRIFFFRRAGGRSRGGMDHGEAGEG